MNQVTQEGLELIRQFEGFRAAPYRDPVGILTVGYGHVVQPGESFALVSEQQATDLMLADIERKKGWIAYYIHRLLNDNQYSAIMSLVYNLGVTPLTKTLGQMVNAGEFEEAANEFPRWVYGRVNGQEEILPGLVKRRAAERDLFLKPVA
jgi:lysozyme